MLNTLFLSQMVFIGDSRKRFVYFYLFQQIYLLLRCEPCVTHAHTKKASFKKKFLTTCLGNHFLGIAFSGDDASIVRQLKVIKHCGDLISIWSEGALLGHNKTV